jgi:hypothetical protein
VRASLSPPLLVGTAHEQSALMLAFTQHLLPFLGAAIGTYMLFRMAFVKRKLHTNPLVILAGMAVEAISIGVDHNR